MDITIENFDQVKVLAISGDIDGKTAPQVQEQILTHMQPGSKILLDMSEVSFMSSAGLRTLIMAQRDVSGVGQLALAGLAERVWDIMSITGFLPFFTTYESVEQALAALK